MTDRTIKAGPVVTGAYVSAGNRGVLALGSSLVNLCAAASGQDVCLLVGNRDNQPVLMRVAGTVRPIRLVHHRMSPKALVRHHFLWVVLAAVLYRLIPLRAVRQAISHFTPWIRAIEQASVVGDVRGGDSFSDIYGMKRFLLGFLNAWTVILVKGSMVQFPQTYGPYKSPLARMLARYLLRRSSVVIARDRESQKVAQDLIGPKRDVWLSPDVAFSLEVVQPERIDFDPPLEAGGREQKAGLIKPIGLNVNGLMYRGGYTRKNQFGLKLDYPAFLRELIPALLREHPGELWLVPHTFGAPGSVESDPQASQELRDSLPSEFQARVRIVAREYDQHEIKGVIGQCDFFIGSRMHACIAALSQGVPCVGVAYSMKFAGVFETVGVKDWVVDGRTVENDEALATILARYRNRESTRQPLGVAAEQACARLRQVFRELMSQATGEATGTNPEERTLLPAVEP